MCVPASASVSNDLEIPSHAPSVVVTTICGLMRIGVSDFSVTDNRSLALLLFSLGLNSGTVPETPDVPLVA